MLKPGDYFRGVSHIIGCGTCGAAIFAVVWDEPESTGAFIMAQGGADMETDAPGTAAYCRCGSFIWWEAAPDDLLGGRLVQTEAGMLGE